MGRTKRVHELTEEQRLARNEYNRNWRKNNPEKRRQYKLKWHQDNPGANTTAAWRRRLIRQYGITPEEYDLLLIKQKGVCAICEQPERRKSRYGELNRLSVDHNHTTKEIRGLLCAGCNVVLGQLFENPSLLQRAIAYLEGTLC